MKMTAEKTLALAAFVGFTLLGAVAFAADETPAPAGGNDQHRGEFRQACGADLQTYCATSKTRDERRACIQANKDKFSETCKTFMASHPRGKGEGKDQSSQQPSNN